MASANPRQKVVWVGRLTGPKGELAKHLAYEIAPRFTQAEFEFIGGPALPAEWPAPAPNVRFTGQVTDLAPYYEGADLVIGAGRVALEAIQHNKPLMAVGEACYVGVINDATIEQGRATNFGDCYAPASIDWQRLEQDLQRLLEGERPDTSAYPAYLHDYRIETVSGQVELAYRHAIAEAALRHHTEVPVLMYHQVTPQPVAGSIHNIFTTTDTLRSQFASLKRRGYEAVTFKELAAGKRVKRPVILTFDDGYENNLHNLLPLLEEFDFKAVIFCLAEEGLTHNAWDTPSGEPAATLMSREQIRQCHASGRIEIASHGLHHRHLPTLSAEELRYELSESKRRLEEWIGDEVVSFAYPYGDCEEREVKAVYETGYLFGIATVSGPIHPADDFYRIRRINLRPKDRGLKFWKKSNGWYLRYCRLKGKDF